MTEAEQPLVKDPWEMYAKLTGTELVGKNERDQIDLLQNLLNELKDSNNIDAQTVVLQLETDITNIKNKIQNALPGFRAIEPGIPLAPEGSGYAQSTSEELTRNREQLRIQRAQREALSSNLLNSEDEALMNELLAAIPSTAPNRAALERKVKARFGIVDVTPGTADSGAFPHVPQSGQQPEGTPLPPQPPSVDQLTPEEEAKEIETLERSAQQAATRITILDDKNRISYALPEGITIFLDKNDVINQSNRKTWESIRNSLVKTVDNFNTIIAYYDRTDQSSKNGVLSILKERVEEGLTVIKAALENKAEPTLEPKLKAVDTSTIAELKALVSQVKGELASTGDPKEKLRNFIQLLDVQELNNGQPLDGNEVAQAEKIIAWWEEKNKPAATEATPPVEKGKGNWRKLDYWKEKMGFKKARGFIDAGKEKAENMGNAAWNELEQAFDAIEWKRLASKTKLQGWSFRHALTEAKNLAEGTTKYAEYEREQTQDAIAVTANVFAELFGIKDQLKPEYKTDGTMKNRHGKVERALTFLKENPKSIKQLKSLFEREKGVFEKAFLVDATTTGTNTVSDTRAPGVEEPSAPPAEQTVASRKTQEIKRPQSADNDTPDIVGTMTGEPPAEATSTNDEEEDEFHII
ncbi:MAG TPA: hypothetical protein VF209_02295 [Patescibacteria group bacterium]